MTLDCLERVGTETDDRRVVLLKSLTTNNRFYALVPPDSGLRNADTVEAFPPGVLLGVAYPCLEDGLNDFAVIRTTFETLDYFPDDAAMRDELMEIINEAREKLGQRLVELRDRLADRTAHFLGTDLAEFRGYALDMLRRGYPRRNLDSMMKLNVFASVAENEPKTNGPEPLFFYRFRSDLDLDTTETGSARRFVAAMFDDILSGVGDDANYTSRHVFDRDVFQKFIAMMFINYATTDPIFYGTHKADYGVSAEKDMGETPLYIAVARQLREIEARYATNLLGTEEGERQGGRLSDETSVVLPDTVAHEEAVLGPIASICAVARRLARVGDTEANEMARVVLADISILVKELKRRDVLSPFAYDPSSNHRSPPRTS